jgi:hypothetical protein
MRRVVLVLAVLALGMMPAAAEARAPSKAKAQRFLNKKVKSPAGQTAIVEKLVTCKKPRKRSRAARCAVVVKLSDGKTCSDNSVNVRYRSKRGSKLKMSGLRLACVDAPNNAPPPLPPQPPTGPGDPVPPPVDPNTQPTTSPPSPPQPPGGPAGGPPPPPGAAQASGMHALMSTSTETKKKVSARASQTFDSCTEWQQGAWQGWPYLWTYSCFWIWSNAVEEDVYFWNPSDNGVYFWFYWYPIYY